MTTGGRVAPGGTSAARGRALGVAAEGSEALNRRGAQASPSCGATRAFAAASYAASWPEARLSPPPR